jgi:hypothetical protein
MQTAPGALLRNHQATELCRERYKQLVQHETAATAQLALNTRFYTYGEELERVEVFKYLGRLLSYNDNNTQAMRANLAKARGCWARVSQVLRAENALPKVCGVFYKATIQAVLLFGSETWNLAPSRLACLEGFHLRAAWQMSGRGQKKLPNGTWRYPNSEAVLREVGLQTINHYIGVHWQHVANFIVNQPIFQLCLEGVRKRGSAPHQFWWEQPLDLEAAGLLASALTADSLTDDGD